jgi:hypothetical protein
VKPRVARQLNGILLQAAEYCRDEGTHDVNLLSLSASQLFGRGNPNERREELFRVTEHWQEQGYGHHTNLNGLPGFRFGAAGYRKADQVAKSRRRSDFVRKLTPNWKWVTGVAAIIAAIASSASAYFSYLSLGQP